MFEEILYNILSSQASQAVSVGEGMPCSSRKNNGLFSIINHKTSLSEIPPNKKGLCGNSTSAEALKYTCETAM